MNEDKALKAFLPQISAISQKYFDIAQITGENFNVFRILGLESSEVRLHSAFIGELLSPKAWHGQGDKFLKLFLNELNLNRFQTTKAIVTIEKNIGYINNDNTKGGRIDIVVDDKSGQGIIIENKIYAGDQHNQLVRYHDYATHAFREFKLIYLTLDGRGSDDYTKGKLKQDVDFVIWSYKNDIINWLENCKKESVNYPILRETITQYINLIKHLTGKSINTQMESEVVQAIILNEDNFMNAHIIKDALDATYNSLLELLHKQLSQQAEKLNLELKEYNVNFYETYTGFTFSNFALKEKNLKIGFEFEDKRCSNFYYGFIQLGTIDPATLSLIKDRFKNIYPNASSNDAWPVSVYSNEFLYWRREQFRDIINGKMADSIIGIVKIMLDIVAFNTAY